MNNPTEQRLLEATWMALQEVPSYVERQAATLAALYTPLIVPAFNRTMRSRPATTILNVSEDAFDEDEEFEPLTEQEMEDFKNEVWGSCARGELSEAEAANMILYEAHLNGLLEGA